MKLRQENPKSKQRCKLLNYLLDKNVSTNIIVQIINPFNGRTDEEKEVIAEKLFNAIKNKETPEEMLKAAQALNL